MSGPINADLDRRKYIGSSDVAAILGISPWRTALDVYLDKTQPPAEEKLDPGRARAMTRGKRMEPYVIDLLAEETGLQIIARGNRYIDPELPFVAAEIDAEAASGENIEIKTVSPFKAKEWGDQQTDEIPLHYTAQVMHALMVTRREVCTLGVLIGADDFRIYRVERDEETIAAIREREIAFWHGNIEAGVPPEPASVADIARLYGHDAGTAIEASDDVLRQLNDLRNLNAQIKELAARADACKEAIQIYMADAAILTAGGKPAATWKSQEARAFDSSAFKEAHPDLYEQFRITRTSRVFRIK